MGLGDHLSSETNVEVVQESCRQPAEHLPSVWAALLIYAASILLPPALVLFVFGIWLYRRGVRPVSLGIAVPSGLQVLRMIAIGTALACFSGGVKVVTICAVSSLAPSMLGPSFFGGLLNVFAVFRELPLGIYALVVASPVLVDPVLEELIFRGSVFTRWKESWGFVRGALLSSIIFSACHYGKSMIGALVFSLVVCKLYHESKNLLSPILVHFTHNLLVVIAGFAFFASGVRTIEDATHLFWSLLPVGVAAVGVGGGFSLWIFVRGGISGDAVES